MIHLVATFLCLFALLLPGPASYAETTDDPELARPTGYVNDLAGVLTPSERRSLETYLERLDGALGVQMAVLTVRDLGGDEPSPFATRLFSKWKIGNAKTNRGLLILNATEQRKIWIQTGYGLEGALPDARVRRVIADEMTPWLKQGRYASAYLSAARSMAKSIVVDSGGDPAAVDSLIGVRGIARRPARGDDDIPPPAIIAMVAVVILISILKARSRRRRGWMFDRYDGGGFGGFGGGFGGFGGGDGGGFSGFGGGDSGGGGAGGDY